MKLIGNVDIWHQLRMAKFSAMKDSRPLPHILLSGAAGCGKTSMAKELADQYGNQFLVVAPQSVKSREDVVAIMRKLDRRGYDKNGNIIDRKVISPPIIFVDEIHRMPVTGQEHLGIAMEEWYVPVEPKKARVGLLDHFNVDKEEVAKWCPRFTLIGATTNDGLLSKPFKDRFKMRFIFNTYDMTDSITIALTHAERLNINISPGAAEEIAKRGRGVPRIIVGLLERCRDFMRAADKQQMDTDLARAAFLLFKIDDTGMTEVDVKILKALYDSDIPLGIDNLSIIVNESRQSISETIEPYLIQRGFMTRSSRGRVLTDLGRAYLVKGGYIKDNTEDDWAEIPTNYKRSF